MGIKAVYEKGVLRPLKNLGLEEGEEIEERCNLSTCGI